jgi:hypothetical protein
MSWGGLGWGPPDVAKPRQEALVGGGCRR